MKLKRYGKEPENQTRSRSFHSSRWSHDHPGSAGKLHTGRREAGLPMTGEDGGAHSAKPKEISCHTWQNGPETNSPIRQALSQALQLGVVDDGI